MSPGPFASLAHRKRSDFVSSWWCLRKPTQMIINTLKTSFPQACKRKATKNSLLEDNSLEDQEGKIRKVHCLCFMESKGRTVVLSAGWKSLTSLFKRCWRIPTLTRKNKSSKLHIWCHPRSWETGNWHTFRHHVPKEMKKVHRKTTHNYIIVTYSNNIGNSTAITKSQRNGKKKHQQQHWFICVLLIFVLIYWET